MVAVGFGVLHRQSSARRTTPIPYTLGALFGSLFIATFVHLLLAYPSGRADQSEGTSARRSQGTRPLRRPARWTRCSRRAETCKPHACPDNLVFVSHDHAAHVVADGSLDGGLGRAVRGRRHVASSAAGAWRRRHCVASSGSVYLAGGLSIVLLAIGFVVTPFSGVGRHRRERRADRDVHGRAVPLPRRAPRHDDRTRRRGGRDLQRRTRTGQPRRGAGGSETSALRDETAQVAYWYEEDEHYVDVDGNRFELPPDTRERVVTRLDYARRAGRGHRPRRGAALQEPELLDGIANAARIALERDKLLVEVRARAQRYSRPPAGDARPDVPHLPRRVVSLLQRAQSSATSSSTRSSGRRSGTDCRKTSPTAC